MSKYAVVVCLKCNHVSNTCNKDVKVDDIVFEACFGACGGKVSSKVVVEQSSEK